MRADARRLLGLCLLPLALLAGSARGLSADDPPTPFLATYATSLNGMPLGIDLRLRLTAAEQNTWLLALEAGSRMMKYTESSLFRWADCRAEPLRYRYDFDGFGVDRKLWLDFDYERKTASGESRKGPVTFAFPADVTDELGLAYAARCHLLRGASKVTYNVATTNGMKPLTYEIDGQESVKTAMGRVEAIRIIRARKSGEKRRSTIWVAPTLGYLMVKMEHIEKIGVRGSATLKAIEGVALPAGLTAKPASRGRGAASDAAH